MNDSPSERKWTVAWRKVYTAAEVRKRGRVGAHPFGSSYQQSRSATAPAAEREIQRGEEIFSQENTAS
jgi:hypothetical protein